MLRRCCQLCGGAAAAALLAIGAGSCSRNADATAPAYRPPGLADFRVPSGTLPADGTTDVPITVQLVPGSDSTERSVVFTTSGGQFERVSGPADSAILVPVNSGLRATAILRAPAMPGLVVVRASAGTTVLEDTVRFGLPATGVTRLTLSAHAVPADGATRVFVAASVPAGATGSARTITFATTLGTFAGVPGAAQSVSVMADSDGTASAILTAPTIGGAAVVTAAAGGASRQDTLTFTTVLSGLSALTITPRPVPADGATGVLVSASVPSGATGAARSVTFTASAGSFAGTAPPAQTVTVVADAGGTASTVLTASQVAGLAAITAVGGGTTLRDTLTFTQALPDTILVDAAHFNVSVATETSVQITAYLRRATGNVSIGTPVAFGATVGSDTSGVFSAPTRSDASGLVIVRYAPRGTPGSVVTIVATTVGSHGLPIQARTTIALIP